MMHCVHFKITNIGVVWISLKLRVTTIRYWEFVLAEIVHGINQ